MPSREIHAAFTVDDGCLKRFGQLDQLRDRGRGPRKPIDDDQTANA